MTIARKKVVFLLLLGLLAARQGAAQGGRRQQRRFVDGQGRTYYRGPLRVTLGGGVALYNGDLAKSLTDKFPGASVSLGLLYRLRPHILVGTEGSYFRVGARDQLPEWGLAFRGDNGLGTVFLRYELLHDGSAYVTSEGEQPLIQPYVQAGVGLLLYSPQTYFGTTRPRAGTSYLPPERNDYPALAGVLPLAAGLSVRAGDQFRVTLEGAYYFTTTDYLDDVSARGNPAQKDGFSTLQLKLEYHLAQ